MPNYLERVRSVMERSPPVTSIDDLAGDLGIQVATAWSYACTLAERAPECHDVLSSLVWPPLITAIVGLDTRGSLREVSARLSSGPLRTNPEWRELPDRLAHLRLCRLVTL